MHHPADAPEHQAAAAGTDGAPAADAAARDAGHHGNALGAERADTAGPAGPGGGSGIAELGHRAGRDLGIRGLVAAGATCPVEIRQQQVREAIYGGISPVRRRLLHARAVPLVSESMSWTHRAAALDRPDEGLAARLERLAAGEAADEPAAGGRDPPAVGVRHPPAGADRERRMLTAAQHLTRPGRPPAPSCAERSRPRRRRPGAVTCWARWPTQRAARGGREKAQPGPGPGPDRARQRPAGGPDRQRAGWRLLAARPGPAGRDLRAAGPGHRRLGRGGAPARPGRWSRPVSPRWPAREPRWPNWPSRRS